MIKVKTPEARADKTIKIIFLKSPFFKKSISMEFFKEYSSIKVIESPTRFGATKAKILATIVIIMPVIILFL